MSTAMSRDEPPGPINWNLLDADQAEAEWRDLDRFVLWLKTAFGLSPAIVPPYWHRHDELIWELSALHLHFLTCYDEVASPSGPISWMREFAETRRRLREWVSTCGTRVDRDRPTRQSTWPGEPAQTPAVEVMIEDRAADFEEFVRADVLGRRRTQAISDRQLLG